VTIFVTIIRHNDCAVDAVLQQSSVVDKGLRIVDYAYERIDVVVGSLSPW